MYALNILIFLLKPGARMMLGHQKNRQLSALDYNRYMNNCGLDEIHTPTLLICFSPFSLRISAT